MGVRFSAQEAIKRGWISSSQAKEMRKTGKSTKSAESPIQRRLYDAVTARFPAHDIRYDYRPFPEKRYKADIAFVALGLAIEADGFQYHGKFLKGFKSDRVRGNYYAKKEWRVLHYFAQQIFSDMESVLVEIEEVVSLLVSKTLEK